MIFYHSSQVSQVSVKLFFELKLLFELWKLDILFVDSFTVHMRCLVFEETQTTLFCTTKGLVNLHKILRQFKLIYLIIWYKWQVYKGLSPETVLKSGLKTYFGYIMRNSIRYLALKGLRLQNLVLFKTNIVQSLN